MQSAFRYTKLLKDFDIKGMNIPLIKLCYLHFIINENLYYIYKVHIINSVLFEVRWKYTFIELFFGIHFAMT